MKQENIVEPVSARNQAMRALFDLIAEGRDGDYPDVIHARASETLDTILAVMQPPADSRVEECDLRAAADYLTAIIHINRPDSEPVEKVRDDHPAAVHMAKHRADSINAYIGAEKEPPFVIPNHMGSAGAELMNYSWIMAKSENFSWADADRVREIGAWISVGRISDVERCLTQVVGSIIQTIRAAGHDFDENQPIADEFERFLKKVAPRPDMTDNPEPDAESIADLVDRLSQKVIDAVLGREGAERRVLLKDGLAHWSTRPGHRHPSIKLSSRGHKVRAELIRRGLT